MIRKLLLVVVGLVLVVAGIAGLILPVVPGILLLAAAAGCFSLASTRFRRGLDTRLAQHPRYRAALRRWRAADGLSGRRRMQLAFWLTLRSLLPASRH